MRLAATRSPVASSSSSAKARSASSVTHRARSRATSRVTSGAIAAGVERSVATSACSRPTPTVRTPERERVHSSIASSRSIRAAAEDDDRSSVGRPTNGDGNDDQGEHPSGDEERDDAGSERQRAGGCGSAVESSTDLAPSGRALDDRGRAQPDDEAEQPADDQRTGESGDEDDHDRTSCWARKPARSKPYVASARYSSGSTAGTAVPSRSGAKTWVVA